MENEKIQDEITRETALEVVKEINKLDDEIRELKDKIEYRIQAKGVFDNRELNEQLAIKEAEKEKLLDRLVKFRQTP